MNEQCRTCKYRHELTPACALKSDEKGGYIRVDNAIVKCELYDKRKDKK